MGEKSGQTGTPPVGDARNQHMVGRQLRGNLISVVHLLHDKLLILPCSQLVSTIANSHRNALKLGQQTVCIRHILVQNTAAHTAEMAA